MLARLGILILCSIVSLQPRPAYAQVCATHPDFVTVIVDMDPDMPGCQSTVRVPPGATVVEDISVYVFDSSESNAIWSMGYFGGLDRGLAFGHTPTNLHLGTVSDMVGTAGYPAHPDGAGAILVFIQEGFAGPEVQYAELGSTTPGVIRANPPGPIFSVDVHLENAQHGDVFAFYLLDFVTVWTEGANGVFSTQGHVTLDTGGDAILDGTVALAGVDPDPSVGVPPGAFAVDFVDGVGNGPATIEVRSAVSAEVRSWSTLKSPYHR